MVQVLIHPCLFVNLSAALPRNKIVLLFPLPPLRSEPPVGTSTSLANSSLYGTFLGDSHCKMEDNLQKENTVLQDFSLTAISQHQYILHKYRWDLRFSTTVNTVNLICVTIPLHYFYGILNDTFNKIFQQSQYKAWEFQENEAPTLLKTISTCRWLGCHP